MLEWMLLPFKRYAEFSGRSRRMEYWSFALLNVIVYFILVAIMFAGGFSLDQMAAMQAPGAQMEPPGALFYVGAGLLAIYALAAFIPNLAVTVRRLHDRNMSGWFVLLFVVLSAIPIVGMLVSIAWLVLMFLPGTPGPNRYGPDPKDPAGVAVFS